MSSLIVNCLSRHHGNPYIKLILSDFYVIDILGLYHGEHHSMKGGERWRDSYIPRCACRGPLGREAGETHSHPAGAHRPNDGDETKGDED